MFWTRKALLYVPGAKVILQGSKTVQTETDEKGRYCFQAVEAGAYTITAEFSQP